MAKEKPASKFRARDFIPVIGYNNYVERNGKANGKDVTPDIAGQLRTGGPVYTFSREPKDPNVRFRCFVLDAYSYLVTAGAAVGATFGIAYGLERIGCDKDLAVTLGFAGVMAAPLYLLIRHNIKKDRGDD